MFLRFCFLLGALLGLTTCRKADAPPEKKVPHGSAWGSFDPTYAMARVTATATGETPVVAYLGSAGYYAFDSLNVGSYTLAFEPTGGYLTPLPQTLVITDGVNSRPVHVSLVRNTATRLVGRRWRLSAYTSTPWGGVAQDEYPTVPGCARDDFFVLAENARGEWDEGPIKCQASAPQTVPMGWDLRANDVELWLDPLGPGPNPYRIEQLTPTTLTVRYYPNPTTATAYRKTFTAF